MYIKDPSKVGSKISREANGLPRMKDIDDSNRPALPQQQYSQQHALNWFDDQVGRNGLDDQARIRLIDRNGNPIHLDKENLEFHTNPDISRFQDRPALVNSLEDALQDPDEVFLKSRGRGNHEFDYFKFYNEEVLRVRVRVEEEQGSRINTFYRMTDKEKVDNERNGVVTYQKRKSK